jgi:hypothetical protein
MMRRYPGIILLLVFSLACRRSHTGVTKEKVDALLEKIGQGTAANEFQEEYFPRAQTTVMMHQMKEYCDFKDRRGNFINDFYEKTGKGYDLDNFIYEFYLKCDSIRFIITYKITDTAELMGFKLEKISKDNPMIIKPERRLKY